MRSYYFSLMSFVVPCSRFLTDSQCLSAHSVIYSLFIFNPCAVCVNRYFPKQTPELNMISCESRLDCLEDCRCAKSTADQLKLVNPLPPLLCSFASVASIPLGKNCYLLKSKSTFCITWQKPRWQESLTRSQGAL